MAEKEKAKEKEKPGEAPAQPAPPAKKKGRKLLLLILPFLGAVGGAAATLAVPKPLATAKISNDHDKAEQFADIAIGDVRANLARSGGLHFCGIELQLTIKSKDMASVAERLGIKDLSAAAAGHGAAQAPTKEVPMLDGAIGTAVRDRIILLLSGKSIEDLEGREKKELLKREVRQELQALLFPKGDGEVESVLFKDLLIQ